jgi:hypothetical protein
VALVVAAHMAFVAGNGFDELALGHPNSPLPAGIRARRDRSTTAAA